ncbi:MAG: hypothetical protein Q9163_003093 [Psora crenata]
MESYAARLASFSAAHPATKKRGSDPKGKRKLKWPHEKPSPLQLAQAGFFYRPTSSCPDNATCYLCRSNLDGWEEEDDPTGEHLKHSPSCGWAIAAFIEQAIEAGDRNVEDPMSERMLDARRMTFGTTWPHENKRGWLCKIQKMVEAEVEAQVDEGMLSTVTTAGKNKRGRKGAKVKKQEASAKAATSNTKELPVASSDTETEGHDFSIKVDQSPGPAAGGRKRKSDNMSAGDSVEGDVRKDPASQALPKKRRVMSTRSSIAVQEVISQFGRRTEDEDVNMLNMESQSVPTNTTSKKGGKGGKKRASSTLGKASSISTASKAVIGAEMPDDDEIEAALEIDLERPLTDEERETEPQNIRVPKGRRLTRTKPGSRKMTASVAPTRRGTRASTIAIRDPVMMDQNPIVPSVSEIQAVDNSSISAHITVNDQADTQDLQEEIVETSATCKPSSKRSPRTAGEDDVEKRHSQHKVIVREETPQMNPPQVLAWEALQQLPSTTTRESDVPSNRGVLPDEPEGSMLDPQSNGDDTGGGTDAKAASQGHGKRAMRKKPAAVKRGAKTKKALPTNREIEDIVQVAEDVVPEVDRIGAGTEPADASKEAKIIQEEAADPTQLLDAAKPAPKAGKGRRGAAKSKVAKKMPSPVEAHRSPEIAPAQPTPAASPQSSDAENHPPSSRPSQLRPPLASQSPSRTETVRIPLAICTPTRSPSKMNTFAKLRSTMPWTAVDLEEIFQTTPSAGNNENVAFAFGLDSGQVALTSPEKKLTLEQWIHFNAQRGEEKLRAECERLVGKFEGEGMRALKTLEGIVCTE